MAPNDLTRLPACKAWLGLTSSSDDGLLAALIKAISQAILADLGRSSPLPTIYTETFDGGGETAIALRHWPVSRLLACSIDGIAPPIAAAPGQDGLLVDQADPSPPGALQRLVYRGGCFAAGNQNVMVTYRAGYEILGEAARVPLAPPYSVTALAPFGDWALDTGVTGASAPYTAIAGTYTFAAVDAGKAVSLTYGYVPADLAQAACEWVADRYAARARIGQSAKTLGGQETTSFIVKAMPDSVSRLLQPYRRIAR